MTTVRGTRNSDLPDRLRREIHVLVVVREDLPHEVIVRRRVGP